EAYDAASRPELAERERAELSVLDGYLPAQLPDDELAAMVATEVAAAAAAGSTGMPAMGRVMKALQPQVAGRAEGGRGAAEGRRRAGARRRGCPGGPAFTTAVAIAVPAAVTTTTATEPSGAEQDDHGGSTGSPRSRTGLSARDRSRREPGRHGATGD